MELNDPHVLLPEEHDLVDDPAPTYDARPLDPHTGRELDGPPPGYRPPTPEEREEIIRRVEAHKLAVAAADAEKRRRRG